MEGNKKKTSLLFDKCHKTASQENFLGSCGFAQQRVTPDSETDSLIGSGYDEDLVESDAIRFVSPPQSKDTVDLEEDWTVHVESEGALEKSAPAKKKLKIPLRDVVKAIVMNSRKIKEEEDKEIEKMSCVQILMKKGFNFSGGI